MIPLGWAVSLKLFQCIYIYIYKYISMVFGALVQVTFAKVPTTAKVNPNCKLNGEKSRWIDANQQVVQPPLSIICAGARKPSCPNPHLLGHSRNGLVRGSASRAAIHRTKHVDKASRSASLDMDTALSRLWRCLEPYFISRWATWSGKTRT